MIALPRNRSPLHYGFRLLKSKHGIISKNNIACDKCGSTLYWSDDHWYDAFCCLECDEWDGPCCSDGVCCFCSDRPNKPSGVVAEAESRIANESPDLPLRFIDRLVDDLKAQPESYYIKMLDRVRKPTDQEFEAARKLGYFLTERGAADIEIHTDAMGGMAVECVLYENNKYKYRWFHIIDSIVTCIDTESAEPVQDDFTTECIRKALG